MRGLHIGLLVAFALLLAGCGGAPLSANANEKPEAPLLLQIEPKGEVIPGELAEFAVSVAVLADAERLRVRVELPSGIAPYSGNLDWEGPLPRGSSHRFNFTLRVPKAGRHIIRARAEMRGAGGQFSAIEEYAVGQGSVRESGVERPTARSRSDGQGVVEYGVE